MNYESWDIVNEVCIYNGTSKGELITEVADYIYFQNHINEYLVDEEAIRELDSQQLEAVGIKVYFNKI